MSEIRLESLAKRFGASTVLDDVSLTVPEGSLTAILGQSGSGKTTLLRIIAGFERVDTGTVTVGGRVVDDGVRVVGAERRGVGYVPQDGALFPNLTALGNIAFGLPRRARATAEELLEVVGLGGLGDRRPHQLSGGQQQRVALARALAVRPGVILLDEPFAALDASMRSVVRRDVARILAEAGTTTVLVTHDQDEALSMADQVALLSHGRILAAAAPRELYSRPRNREVAGSIGEMNILEATLDGTSATCLLGTVALTDPIAGTGFVFVRSEQVEVVESAAPGTIRGTVTQFDYFGHDSLARIDVDGSEVTARLSGDRSLAKGQAVWLAARGAVSPLVLAG
jgi:iron(III) transport system ATP-binding protein